MAQGRFRDLTNAVRIACVLAAGLLSACGSDQSGSTAVAEPSAQAKLGKLIFEDTALSKSGQQSCASCHVAKRAFASDDGRAVPLGGANMDLPGFRNAPSLMYASFTPTFHIETDGTPVGGFFRDGRAATLAEQAQRPFVTSFEMANADAAEVVTRLKARPYLAQFTALYGSAVLDQPDTALQRIGQALAAYQSEDPDFHPFSSKYDAWTAGKAALSDDELAGLALYNNGSKGNCSGCHPSARVSATVPGLFTDFTYDNLGVPRNTDIAANDNATMLAYVPHNSDDGVHGYYDLGLCGPLRENVIPGRRDLCGAFKVPTLRNVALTAPYFHNGRFATLIETLRFYVTRDTDAATWYPAAGGGGVTKFNDLPAQYGGQFVVLPGVPGSDLPYFGNVNTAEVPYERHIGEVAHLNEAEIAQLLSFLCTLTDGYDPANPASFSWPAQCPQATP